MASLAEALEVWRETRSAAMAAVVERLGELALVGWTPPSGRLYKTFHARWLEAVADPAHRGWAVKRLEDKLPGTDQGAAAMLERLIALHAAGPDPRVGKVVFRGRFRFVRSGATWRELSQTCIAICAESGDDALRVEIEADLDNEPRKHIDGLPELLEQIPRGRAPTVAELARFAALVPTHHDAIDLAPLEREVYARPDDDAARLVLADALQDRGDPRGELIALQIALAKPGDDPRVRERDRVMMLLHEHGKDWLGPLRDLAYRVQFDRGFVSRLELDGGWSTLEAEWAQAILEPALGTVEDLIPGKLTGDRYAALVTSTAMRSLRRIEVFDTPVIRALDETPAKLVHIACPLLKRGRYRERFVAEVLPACERFGELRSFALNTEALPDLMSSPIFERLMSVTVSGDLPLALLNWVMELGTSANLVLVRHAQLPPCLSLGVAWSGSITLSFSGGTATATIEGPWGFAAFLEHAARFPKLTSVELIDPPRNFVARIKKLRWRNLDIQERPARPRSAIVTGIDK